jgi:hypothetical protein
MAIQGVTTRAGQTWPTHLPGLLGPAIAALAVTAAVSGRAGLADLGSRIVRVRLCWFWYAVLAATAAVAAGAMALQGVLGRGWPTGAHLPARRGGVGAVAPAVVLVVGVFAVVRARRGCGLAGVDHRRLGGADLDVPPGAQCRGGCHRGGSCPPLHGPLRPQDGELTGAK